MDSELIIKNDNDTALVCFAGFARFDFKIGDIPPYDFLKFMTINFKNVDKYFYRDMEQICYHHGIDKISTDIDTTVIYFQKLLEKYKRVIFTGNSAGAYASILYGSLLNVSEVIVFNPITILRGRKDKFNRQNQYNLKYVDLSQNVINETTKYYFYGDSSITDKNNYHHIKNCKNISHYPNVNITYKNGIDLYQIKITGELYNIYNGILNLEP